jgi:NAD(P)-dependent dehydrogenase (short-subunit alcohol dehydrogenase family)
MPRPKKLNDSVVVITGASSGIGRATALAFARGGATVVLAARREVALGQLATECAHLGGRAQIAPLDVTDPGAVAELAQAAARHHGRLDAWIHNAGVALFAKFEQAPPDVFRRVIETNFFGYVNAVRATLPLFRQQGHGILMNVVPSAHRTGQGEASAHCASHAALEGLEACLREELADTPEVHVSTIFSGAVDTPLLQHAANYTGRRLLPSEPLVPPHLVAGAIVECFKNPRPHLELGPSAARLALHRLSTRALVGDAVGPADGSAPAAASPGNLFEPAPGSTGMDGGWRRAQRIRPGWLTRRLLEVARAVTPTLDKKAGLTGPLVARLQVSRRALRPFDAGRSEP